MKEREAITHAKRRADREDARMIVYRSRDGWTVGAEGIQPPGAERLDVRPIALVDSEDVLKRYDK